MILYYQILFGISVFMLFLCINNRPDKVNANITTTYLLGAISNFAFLALALSSNLQEAILANKILYIGGCFIPLLYCFIISDICNIKLPKPVVILMSVFSMIVYIFVLTIGYSDLYYKSVSLTKSGNVSVLIKEYGAFHFLSTILFFSYMSIALIFIFYTFCKKEKYSFKTLVSISGMLIGGIVLFLISRFLKFHTEITPFMYVVSMIIFYFIRPRVYICNLENSIFLSYENNKAFGYIVLDKHGNFMTCNELAVKFIPELATVKVEKKLDTSIGTFKTFYSYLDNINSETFEEKLFIGDTQYLCSIRKVYYNSKINGFVFELSDITEKENYVSLLESFNTSLFEQVEKKTENIINMQNKIILGVADVIENRDASTGGHVRRTSDVVRIFVEYMRKSPSYGLDDEFCKNIIKAAPMHDLGKIAIPDKILLKPTSFTDKEYEIMKIHPEKSMEIVKAIFEGVTEEDFINVAMNLSLYHHERWDGKGYPKGLSKEEIPFEARIMALADFYDAIISERCYKKAMSFEEAAKIVEDSMGTQFDPDLLPVFRNCREYIEEYYTIKP